MRHAEEIAFVECANALTLDELKDYSGAFKNSAVVQCVSVADRAGTEIAGVSLPITLDYQGNTNGRYIGVLPSSAQLVPGKRYIAKLVITSGGITDTRYLTFRCEKRSTM